MTPVRWWLVAAATIVFAAVVLARRGPMWDSARWGLRHLGLLTTTVSAAGGAQTPLPPPSPPALGINLAPVNQLASTMPFANFAIGSDWFDESWRKLSEAEQDRNGNLLSAPKGRAQRYLTVPPTGPAGIDIHCSFTGAGTLWVHLNPDRGRAGSHSLDVHVVADHGRTGPPLLVVEGFDPARPLRNLDCREARVARSERVRPEALRPLRGFGVVRFMDWQNANANLPVSWQDRHLPGSLRVDRDGIAIEDMLAIADAMKADPWFVLPWNASDDYIARFAAMVRDRLPPDRSVYVEVGNEVWNGIFPVAKQAIAEGLARHLSTDSTEAGLRRYAQRTVEVMRTWEAAFAGRPGLVRVLSTIHAYPPAAEIALSFADTAAHVDALATAPYFGDTLGGPGHTREEGLAVMEKALPKTLDLIVANRRIAVAHGKRYIGYEGGPSLAIPMQNDITNAIQHDQTTYALTRRFLTGWAERSGDVLCLYNSIGRPSSWGMWGLAEWEDDSPAQAPKLRAAQEMMTRTALPPGSIARRLGGL